MNLLNQKICLAAKAFDEVGRVRTSPIGSWATKAQLMSGPYSHYQHNKLGR